MKLTESRLRSIIREELSKLTERVDYSRIAPVIQAAVNDVLRLRDIELNQHSLKSGEELEFVNRDDDRGFFVRAQESGDQVQLHIVGRGREYGEDGTKVMVNLDNNRAPQKVADAIEEEPLAEPAGPPVVGRGKAPRRY